MAAMSAQVAYMRVEDSYSFRADNMIDPALRERIAVSLGYDPQDTSKIPEEANIGEGCGNPLLIASLSEGEKVVDLGCGGGLDVFLASKKVGGSGKVIGVDMNPKMIDLAKRNAETMNATNVEFIHSKINDIPLETNSVDCVLSNCVLNLVPEEDKRSVIQEIHRILRPCGRLAVSDFLALKPLPADMKNDPDLLAGCVGGAIEVGEMEKYLVEIGFDDVLLVDTQKDLNLYKDGETSSSVTPCCVGSSSCGPAVSKSGRKELDYDLNEWISSFQIFGHKSCGKNKGPKQTCRMSGRQSACCGGGVC
ncbi:hypothetical protein GYMLUDRAFT_36283 [Collybiopsis luxurians FD-317 M1]|nr:hypothetical protein GYMLUDRAFT_36283 [Collybiopsis luxurians FD-317 M1]